MHQSYFRNYHRANQKVGIAVFGIAVGMAAILLSDKKNRDQVRKTLKDWKTQSQTMMGQMKDAYTKMKRQSKQTIVEKMDQAKNKLQSEDIVVDAT